MKKQSYFRGYLFLFSVLLSVLVATQAVAQDRAYTDFERKRFELDKKFAATVEMNDGSRLVLKRFQIGTGMFRHKIETGDAQSGLLFSLSNLVRIIRIGNLPDQVTFIMGGNAEMTTTWSHYQLQKLWGITEDGKEWESTIDKIREIEIRQTEPPPDR